MAESTTATSVGKMPLLIKHLRNVCHDFFALALVWFPVSSATRARVSPKQTAGVRLPEAAPHPPASTHSTSLARGSFTMSLQRPCCSKRTSGARVLSTTGFDKLRQHDDVRVPEPSQARHDLPRQQGLEHWQQDDQLQTESLLVSRHRQLLMTDFVINKSEAATGLFQGLRASLRQAKDLDLLRQGENSLASCLAAMVARNVVWTSSSWSSPDMLDPRSSATSCATRGLCSWTALEPKAGKWTR